MTSSPGHLDADQNSREFEPIEAPGRRRDEADTYGIAPGSVLTRYSGRMLSVSDRSRPVQPNRGFDPWRRSDCNCHLVRVGRCILIEMPPPGNVETAIFDMQDRRRTAEFEPKPIERKRQSHAARLDIGFLERPVGEEA